MEKLVDSDTLRAAIELSPILSFVWGNSGDREAIFVSNAIRQFGYTPEEFLNGTRRYADIIHPDDVAPTSAKVEASIADGNDEFRLRYRIMSRDGQIRVVLDHVHVMRDAEGTPTRNHSTIMDVTEWANVEGRATHVLAMSGNLFIALDRDGRIVEANQTSSDIVGEPLETLIGLNWFDEFVTKEHVDASRAANSSGHVEHPAGAVVHCVNVIVSRQGERRNIHWSYVFESNGPDRGDLMIAFGSDLTALYTAQSAADNFARFPENNPNPVMRLDRAGNVVFANSVARQILDVVEAAPEGRHPGWDDIKKISETIKFPIRRDLNLDDQTIAFTIVPAENKDHLDIYGQDVTVERHEKRRLLDISENLPGAIFQYGLLPDGRDSIGYMSRGCEEIWGLSREVVDADPRLIWAEVHPDDVAELQKSIFESARDLTPWHHVWHITTPDGTEKWLQGRGAPSRLSNGATRWNSVVLDITAAQTSAEAVSSALKKTVDVLSSALEKRDPYTAGHEANVSRICKQIGWEMKLDEDRIAGLALAATVHDIGKIAIPAEILSKPTRLLPAEFDLVKYHPETGADLLKDIDFEWPIGEMILQHHERMDGSGYPRGLKGDEILLEARIIGVADTLEAMASHRPYRPGLGIEKAAREIEDGAGTRYDADVAKACLKLINSGEISL